MTGRVILLAAILTPGAYNFSSYLIEDRLCFIVKTSQSKLFRETSIVIRIMQNKQKQSMLLV